MTTNEHTKNLAASLAEAGADYIAATFDFYGDAIPCQVLYVDTSADMAHVRVNGNRAWIMPTDLVTLPV